MIKQYEKIIQRTFGRHIKAIMRTQRVLRVDLIQKTNIEEQRMRQILDKEATPSLPEAILITEALIVLTNYIYTPSEVLNIKNYKLRDISNRHQP